MIRRVESGVMSTRADTGFGIVHAGQGFRCPKLGRLSAEVRPVNDRRSRQHIGTIAVVPPCSRGRSKGRAAGGVTGAQGKRGRLRTAFPLAENQTEPCSASPRLTRRREPWPPPGSHGHERQHLDHCRGCAGRASIDPLRVARHSRLPHRGGVRRLLSLAPYRDRHRQQQAAVQLAPLASAGDAAQRALPPANRPDHRRRRRDDAPRAPRRQPRRWPMPSRPSRR